MIIGITGGTGCGKSTVCNELKKYGCVIIDADNIYKELTMPAMPLVFELTKAFGSDIVNDDGSLNRKILAKKAFSSDANTKLLNNITHSAINAEMNRRIESNKNKNIILDVPLLLETGGEKQCDEVWLVTASIETRINRVMLRDNISREEVIMRINHQLSDDERRKKADVEIVNDDLEQLKLDIAGIVKERLKC